MQCLGAKLAHSLSPAALPGVARAKDGAQCFLSSFGDVRHGVLSLGCIVGQCDWCSFMGGFPCATIQRTLSAHSAVGGRAGSPQVQEGSGYTAGLRKGEVHTDPEEAGCQEGGAGRRPGGSQRIPLI